MENAVSSIKKMAERMREHALTMAFSPGANGAHLGGGLSMIEIMATLYGGVLRLDPKTRTGKIGTGLFPAKGMVSLHIIQLLPKPDFFRWRT